MCLEITYSAIVEFFFWCIKNWPKWKILYFSRNWHPKNPCATIWKFSKPMALQVWCLACTKNFEWLANGTDLGQNSLNNLGVKYATTRKTHSINHISCKEYLNKNILIQCLETSLNHISIAYTC